ncbi:MAG: type IV pili twitching motility protein PilT, partial [Moraxella sp.]
MHNEESLLAFAEETLNEAKAIMYSMLTKVVEIGGSDLFITAD